MEKTTTALDYLCNKVDKMVGNKTYEITQSDRWLIQTYWSELHDYISPDTLTFNEEFTKLRRYFIKKQ